MSAVLQIFHQYKYLLRRSNWYTSRTVIMLVVIVVIMFVLSSLYLCSIINIVCFVNIYMYSPDGYLSVTFIIIQLNKVN